MTACAENLAVLHALDIEIGRATRNREDALVFRLLEQRRKALRRLTEPELSAGCDCPMKRARA
jgi:hypothetical protein